MQPHVSFTERLSRGKWIRLEDGLDSDRNGPSDHLPREFPHGTYITETALHERLVQNDF